MQLNNIEKDPRVKSRCVLCAKKIKNPDENYIVRGNYCQNCCGVVDKIVGISSEITFIDGIPSRIEKLEEKKAEGKLKPKQEKELEKYKKMVDEGLENIQRKLKEKKCKLRESFQIKRYGFVKNYENIEV